MTLFCGNLSSTQPSSFMTFINLAHIHQCETSLLNISLSMFILLLMSTTCFTFYLTEGCCYFAFIMFLDSKNKGSRFNSQLWRDHFFFRFSACGQVPMFDDATPHGVGLPPSSYCIFLLLSSPAKICLSFLRLPRRMVEYTYISGLS